MAHLTITVDEDLLERARSKAQEEGTSVDALLRSYLEAYSNSREEREQAVKKLLELSRNATSGSGGRRWTREELTRSRPVEQDVLDLLNKPITCDGDPDEATGCS